MPVHAASLYPRFLGGGSAADHEQTIVSPAATSFWGQAA
jgi:hypothetical protein